MGPVLNGLVKLQSIESRLRAAKAKLARCRRNIIIQENQIRSLQNALEQYRETHALDFSMLLITDVVRNSSRLIIANPHPILDELPYPKLPDGTRDAPGVVSRKKQLLPALLGLLEK